MKHEVMLMRKDTHYRSDAFKAGLERHGYHVVPQGAAPIGPNTVLVLWNRKAGTEDRMAASYERGGAKVIIAENGYIGQDSAGQQLYAMALSGHNGSGKWFVGNVDRFARLGVELKPWR